MFAKKLIAALSLLISQCLFAQQTGIVYLSGTDKDHTVPWDFMCTKGRRSGEWTKIPVPSNWELQGFGNYAYGHDKNKTDEQGLYKHSFHAPKEWMNKKIWIVFEGVMTDTEVKINGSLAGPVHQGGFYQFKYDITPFIRSGESNLLEVTVNKVSSNKSLERAERGGDFWVFGGIYRPVYLQILPAAFIERVAIDAKANGDFSLQVFAQNAKGSQVIEAQVQDLSGKPIGKSFSSSAGDSLVLKNQLNSVKSWNVEHPNLYNVIVSLKENGKIIHTIKQRFGFRTVEFRKEDGFYVNGTKIIFKGVNRHSFWPTSGRTLSREVHLMDINAMKEMNMNAVRMSHYPPDQEFLDLCDSLGLMVIDELTGWQAAYDTTVGRKLVKELVLRDVNHPSVIIWSNGNEGGWNRALDGDYHWYDPQKRFVMHPWEKFNGTETKHYPDFNYVTNSVLYGNEVFYPTEFMHGLYDGGHGAALEDFWNEMMKHRAFSGGFLWVLADEGIVRTDKDGIIDTDGNHGADGILGPYREKEGSFYTIKEIWSPVVIHNKSISKDLNVKIELENRYHYTNLNQCKFEWKIISYPRPNEASVASKVLAKGTLQSPSINPGERGYATLQLPKNSKGDALLFTASDWKGAELFTWSWPLRQPEEIAAENISTTRGSSSVRQESNAVVIVNDNISYYFDNQTAYLQKVVSGNKTISFSDGPKLANGNVSLQATKHYAKGDTNFVEVSYKGDHSINLKWTFAPGQLPQLDYTYSIKGPADYMGITFNYPEEKVKGVKWAGTGPYRVWKNRLKGQQLGVWEKEYNNTVTGESWKYPEFKGWHAQLNWVQFQTTEGAFTVYAEDNNMFLQLLKPDPPKGAANKNTEPQFPEGNIGFMHAISAIGTKFQAAEVMGPQSQKNIQLNYTPLHGRLRFDFR